MGDAKDSSRQLGLSTGAKKAARSFPLALSIGYPESMLKWIGKTHPQVPLVLTSPHSGEAIPPEANWLQAHPRLLLLTDVDRFVDRLYEDTAQNLSLPLLCTEIHRYAADLNRYPEDVDADSVEDSKNPSGTHPKGFHWVLTTQGERVMSAPISRELHQRIVTLYHDRFHEEFAKKLEELKSKFPGREIYHFDCHSMPSVGTGAHLDQGQRRPDVVISDQEGQSTSASFKDLTISAFEAHGFKVGYNWPYKGGRITQRYGRPEQGHHTIQIELNRALYMDEKTKEPLPGFASVAERLEAVLKEVVAKLSTGSL